MMCADAGLHADQARRQVAKPGFHLATRPLLSQHQGSTAILADQMERVLADIDADDGDFATVFLGHGVLRCLRCPSPAWTTGRAGARPDHPISWRVFGNDSTFCGAGGSDRHSAFSAV